MATTSQQQGAEFEKLLHELLGRVIASDLGYTLVQNSLQSSGVQYGKDIQTKWKDLYGRECSWHIECKSHQEGVLHQKEVVDKIVDIYLSSHRVNVWCLALAHIEPGNWLDDRLTWANERLDLPFSLEVLSPARRFIKNVFACHADLFGQLYPGSVPPSLDKVTRKKYIAEFAEFLDEASERGRQQALRRHGEWELISPQRIRSLADDEYQRRAYLRGLTPTCPWPAIAHSWAIERSSAEKPLLEILSDAPPGFSYRCVLGAGGEGKSTLLKRIAWLAATDQSEWVVLWRDGIRFSEAAELPIKWLESLAEGTKVLMCVDGVDHVSAITAGIDAHWELSRTNKKVVALLADRGNQWFHSSLRRELIRARSRPDEKRIELRPLSPSEQRLVAEQLAKNGLLYGKSIDEAVSRLKVVANTSTSSPEKPYLLPTLMQLTDPEDRGFEAILESVLSDLGDLPDRAAFRIILAAAICHGASLGLPESIAEALAGSSDQLAQALATLDSELLKQLGVPTLITPSLGNHRYFLHHAVVSDGVVSTAYKSHTHHAALLAICGDIVESVRPRLDAEGRMPDDLFNMLDKVPAHLDQDLQLYEPAARFLSAWFSLDTRGFPALHRLAECYTRWLQDALKQQPANEPLVETLAHNARDAYRNGLDVAGKVLADANRPPWFAGYSIREDEIREYHGWSVMEGTIAMHLSDPSQKRASFLRSVFLSLLVFEPERRDANARACGTLALTLINMGSYELAAKVTQASIELKNAPQIIQKQKGMLERNGVQLPAGGIDLLGAVFESLCTGPLLAEWESLSLFSSRHQHVDKLREILLRASKWLPSKDAITSAMLTLQKEAAT